MFERKEWAFGPVPSKGVVKKVLEAIGADTAERVDRLYERKLTDPVELRAAAIEYVPELVGQLPATREALEIPLAPYLAEHPALPAALLFEARAAAEVGTPVELLPDRTPSVFFDRIESVLWWEKIRRVSAEQQFPLTDDTACEVVRDRMVTTGTRYDARQFADAMFPRGGHGALTQTGGVLTQPLSVPDVGSVCGGEPSPDRVRKLAAFYWAFVFEQFGLGLAAAELERRFLQGKIDVGPAIGLILHNRLVRHRALLPADELMAIMLGVFGPASDFPETVRALGHASARTLQGRQSRRSETIERARLQSAAEDLQCYCSAAACGVVAAATTLVIAEAAEIVSIFGAPEVACGVGLGDCSASVLNVTIALTPDLDRVSVRTASDRVRYGKPLLDGVAELPCSDAKWTELAENAVLFQEALCDHERDDDHDGWHHAMELTAGSARERERAPAFRVTPL